MRITHFVSEDQAILLFRIFAKPVDHFGEIDWVAPRWWYFLYATVQR